VLIGSRPCNQRFVGVSGSIRAWRRRIRRVSRNDQKVGREPTPVGQELAHSNVKLRKLAALSQNGRLRSWGESLL
jgi:hypothetical protein